MHITLNGNTIETTHADVEHVELKTGNALPAWKNESDGNVVHLGNGNSYVAPAQDSDNI